MRYSFVINLFYWIECPLNLVFIRIQLITGIFREIMVLSNEDKAAIKNDLLEKD